MATVFKTSRCISEGFAGRVTGKWPVAEPQWLATRSFSDIERRLSPSCIFVDVATRPLLQSSDSPWIPASNLLAIVDTGKFLNLRRRSIGFAR